MKKDKEKLYLGQLRGKSQMTQEEIAKELGVSKFTWRNWEIGKSAPDLWELQKIKQYLMSQLTTLKFYQEILFNSSRIIDEEIEREGNEWST